ncbi:MAG: carboxypeptidase-like regulatory domain-containing protein [Acidobacteriota bacterium]|nr:carboxypeptidase-like regulatory domain-containing protein [Acidobacteriota bacterium]
MKDEQGSVKGVLTDRDGAAVDGAKITLINEQTGEELNVTSTRDGAFKFSNLTAGNYSLKVEAKGFATHTVKDIIVKTYKVVQITLTLHFKGETTTVGVLAIEPEIESSNGTTIFRGEVLQRLPLPK